MISKKTVIPIKLKLSYDNLTHKETSFTLNLFLHTLCCNFGFTLISNFSMKKMFGEVYIA